MSRPKYVHRSTTNEITNVATMIQIGIATPSTLPKPILSMSEDVMYVVFVCDQMLTMPW